MKIRLYSAVDSERIRVPARGSTAGSLWWVVFNPGAYSMMVVIVPGPDTLYRTRGDEVFAFKYPYQTRHPGVMLPMTTLYNDAGIYPEAMRSGVYLTFNSMFGIEWPWSPRTYYYSVNMQWRPPAADNNFHIGEEAIVNFCTGVAQYLCVEMSLQQRDE